MTDTFRAMCAELIEAVLSDDSHIDCMQIARRARALLAEPVVEGPSEKELYDLFCEHAREPVESMRAALARWGRPATAPVPVSELPQGWHMLCDTEPEPGAMCDWVIMAPWGCDHGKGKWRDYDGVSPCEFFNLPVGWPVYYKGFASADGVMVSDPKLTAWRMLPLPTMAAEARL